MQLENGFNDFNPSRAVTPQKAVEPPSEDSFWSQARLSSKSNMKFIKEIALKIFEFFLSITPDFIKKKFNAFSLKLGCISVSIANFFSFSTTNHVTQKAGDNIGTQNNFDVKGDLHQTIFNKGKLNINGSSADMNIVNSGLAEITDSPGEVYLENSGEAAITDCSGVIKVHNEGKVKLSGCTGKVEVFLSQGCSTQASPKFGRKKRPKSDRSPYYHYHKKVSLTNESPTNSDKRKAERRMDKLTNFLIPAYSDKRNAECRMDKLINSGNPEL